MKSTFKTKEVSELTGLTLRQLQWLDERRVVRAERSTRNRCYPSSVCLLLLAIAELRRKGVSLAGVRRFVRQLRNAADSSERYVLVGSFRTMQKASAGDALESIACAAERMAVLDLHRLRERLEQFKA